MKGWRRASWVQAAGLLLMLGPIIHFVAAGSWPMPVCPVQYPGATPPPSGSPPGNAPLPPQALPSLSPSPFAPDGTPFVPQTPFVGPEQAVPRTPIVQLRVRAPLEVPPEKEIEYHLTVENVSRSEAHHVIVRDRLPRGITIVRAHPEPTKNLPPKDGSTDLIWEIGTLKPGERKEIVVALQAGATDEISNNAYVQFEHGQTIKTRIAKPSLSLRIVVPPRNVLPDPIALRLEVTNTGSIPARDVVLKDELPDGLVFGSSKPELKGSEKPLEWKLGTLQPGETQRVHLQVIPTQPGTFANKAEVKAAGGSVKKAKADIAVGEAKPKSGKTEPQQQAPPRAAPPSPSPAAMQMPAPAKYGRPQD